MKEAALWIFGIAGAFGAVWLFADVYMARKHMREAIRQAAYRGHVPPRPLPRPVTPERNEP